MAYPTLAHAPTNYRVSQFGHSNRVKADKLQNGCSHCILNWYIVTNANMRIHSSCDAGAVTMSLTESDFNVVISMGHDMDGLKLTGSTGLDCWICDQSGMWAGRRDGMHSCICGFHEPSLMWLLPGQEVHCGIYNYPGTLSRASGGSLNVIGSDDAASSAVWGWTTAGTFNSVALYFSSLSRK